MIPSGCLVQVSNISATLDNRSMVAKKQSVRWINTKRHIILRKIAELILLF
jgi:hypothetical protein